jgi:hypothetical protein
VFFDALMVEHLVALVPGQRASQPGRDFRERADERVTDCLGRMASRYRNQHCEPELALDQRRDRRALSGANQVGVGPGRGVGIAPGSFPRPALRTGRATFIASGAPRIAAAMQELRFLRC